MHPDNRLHTPFPTAILNELNNKMTPVFTSGSKQTPTSTRQDAKGSNVFSEENTSIGALWKRIRAELLSIFI